MRERAYTFGGGDVRLVGIVSQAVDANDDTYKPGIILLNAGVLHRVGPARLNVDLSRHLSAHGYTCLRFDLSGLGDSDPRHDRLGESERAVADIREAMTFLQDTLGQTRFVLVGLCSGADNAHRVALSDDRVTGLALFDPYGYRTLGFHLRHYAPRLLQLAPWARFLRRTAQTSLQTLRLASPRAAGESGEIFERDFAARTQVKSELQRLVRRGVAHLLVYSGGVREHYYNHRNQFREMFPDLDPCDRIDLEYFGEADHVYTLLTDRQRLIHRVSGWICQRFPGQST